MRFFILLVLTLAIWLAPISENYRPATQIIGISQSTAQEQPAKKLNLFQQIFGPRKSKPQAKVVKKQKVRKKQQSTRPKRAAQPKIIKNENAAKILVVGDFLAGTVARGLKSAFANDANLIVVNASKGNSGLVRKDFYDWDSQILPLIEEHKPVAVIMMAGANDRQSMRVKDQSFPKLSDEWSQNYKQRIRSFSSKVVQKSLPLFWISNPPMRSGSLSRDYLVFNAMLKAQLSSDNIAYIDIWDKFTTDEGKYTSKGPDVSGQVRTLRTSDGINFTKVGNRKLAFYVEQPLRVLLKDQLNGISSDISLLNLPGDQLGVDLNQTPPALAKRTKILPLATALAFQTTELVTSVPDIKPVTQLVQSKIENTKNDAKVLMSPHEQLLATGIAPDPPAYRADNFQIVDSDF